MSRLERIKAMLSASPDDAFLLFALAQELRNADQPEAAVETFRRLRTLHPDYVGLYYHLAAVLLELEEGDAAREVFDAGIVVARRLQDQHALAELQNARMNAELEGSI